MASPSPGKRLDECRALLRRAEARIQNLGNQIEEMQAEKSVHEAELADARDRLESLSCEVAAEARSL